MRRVISVLVLTGVISVLPSMSLRGAGTWTSGDNISIPPNIVSAGNSAVFEAHYTIENQEQFEYRNGSHGALIAGQQVRLKPGFKAETGAELWAVIDGNFNGISDYLESLDADGDGYFDALEQLLGTSPTLNSNSYTRDFDGDGNLDVIEDVIHGGTPSSYIPIGAYPGYMGKLAAWYTAYGGFYSVYVGGGLVSGLIPSLSEYFDLDFGAVYTFFAFEGWELDVRFPTEVGVQYLLYRTNSSGEWVPFSNIITGDGYDWVGYSYYLYNYLWQIPQFVTLVRLGTGINHFVLKDESGNVLGTVQPNNPTPVTITLPAVGSIKIDPVDAVGAIFGQDAKLEWSINGGPFGTIQGTLEIVNGGDFVVRVRVLGDQGDGIPFKFSFKKIEFRARDGKINDGFDPPLNESQDAGKRNIWYTSVGKVEPNNTNDVVELVFPSAVLAQQYELVIPQAWQAHVDVIEKEFIVTGHCKCSQAGSNQMQPP